MRHWKKNRHIRTIHRDLEKKGNSATRKAHTTKKIGKKTYTHIYYNDIRYIRIWGGGGGGGLEMVGNGNNTKQS